MKIVSISAFLSSFFRLRALHRILTLTAIGVLTMTVKTSLAADSGLPMVTLHTDYGEIVIQVNQRRAPITGANFLRHVEKGFYDAGAFYRTVTFENDNGEPKIEVIQGGRGNDSRPVLSPIQHESTATTGILHTDGVISMARGGVDTASSEFFICIGDQPGLDHGAKRNPDGLGFAAFGRVVQGMDVVRKIHRLPANAPTSQAYVVGQIIELPVGITAANRTD